MFQVIKNFEINQIKTHKLRFYTGDTIEVIIWIVEGNKKRLQIFEGTVIAIKNRGLHSSFTVRKITSGEGVERVFHIHSPVIKHIRIKKLGMVRKSKLYYLRNLSGKAARIKTRLN